MLDEKKEEKVSESYSSKGSDEPPSALEES